MLSLLIGLVALAVGLWQGWSTMRMVRSATATTGRVVADVGTPSVASTHPTVEFRTATGAVVSYRQNGMESRPVGTAVPLLYNPADPTGTAVARGFWQLWFPVVGHCCSGSPLSFWC